MSQGQPNTIYEAPVYDDEGIRQALQNGMLGEHIRHVTIEQLKNISPALMMQVCTSILQKLDIDTDHLGQAFLQPHMDNPYNYRQKIFLALHLPSFINQLIPCCGSAKFQLHPSDLLYPKWKRLKKFLSLTINYIYSWEGSLIKWKELNSKLEDLNMKRDELLNQNNKLENAIKEIDTHLVVNGTTYEAQRKELQEAGEEFEELRFKQVEPQKENSVSKEILNKRKQVLLSTTQKFDKIQQEIEAHKSLIVNSPDREIGERAELMKNLNSAKDECEKLQGKLRESQWKTESVSETLKLAQHLQQQLNDVMTFCDNIRKLQDDIINQQFQNESQSLSLIRLKQESDTLKQQIIDEREQSHRWKLRTQKQLATKKQKLEELEDAKSAIESKLQNKGDKIKYMLSAYEKEKAALQQIVKEHDMKMEEFYQKDLKFRERLEKLHEATLDYMDHSPIVETTKRLTTKPEE